MLMIMESVVKKVGSNDKGWIIRKWWDEGIKCPHIIAEPSGCMEVFVSVN